VLLVLLLGIREEHNWNVVVAVARAASAADAGMGKMKNRVGEDKERECVARAACADAHAAHRGRCSCWSRRRSRSCWPPLPPLVQGPRCHRSLMKEEKRTQKPLLGSVARPHAVSGPSPLEEKPPPPRALFFSETEIDRRSWVEVE